MSLMKLFFRLMLDPAFTNQARPARSNQARSTRRRHDERGFTLTELMVVIFIIGLLATVVMINVLPSQDRAMVTKARADIATLETALEQYRLDNLVYPATSDGLNALVTPPPALAQPERYRRGGYIRKLPADPWGRPYNYQAPGPSGKAFDVWSMGADGAPGGTDENADIRAGD
ncbi:MAG: type II secretion system protein GspG [Sphingopyxis macrogoltabida]|uniref:Type II secretion system core protein G n=1 Tax=Sphingopyxis macrogoltabida TaxID=33050 RepID=A0A2W5MXK4_SPHMC|nr:MAG: type II secretion system protein GspG [Sphingopyxis macrogoltabida]